MKKILKLSLILTMFTFLMVGSVYAAITCNVELQSINKQFEKKEQFTVECAISNIQSELGAIALSATLNYDKTDLDLVKLEGQNGWETPIDGASYNVNNGKLAISRNGLGKNDEVILKMTFEVKDTAKANTTVELNDVKISDGNGTAKFTSIKKNITIKSTTQPTEEEKNPPKTDNEDILLNIESNNNNKDKTISTDKLPKAGNSSSILPIFILLLVIATTIYTGVKIKLMSKYIK